MVVIVLALLLLSGCAASTSADPGVVTLALDNAPTNLDPRIGQDASSQRLFEIMFVSLVRKDDRFNLRPDLALSWDIPDSRTYIFHLRTDAKFHDGRPITSKDVVFTFRSMMDGTVRSAKAGSYRPIESVEAPDAYTVVFKLKEPYAPLLWNLSRGAVGIVPDGSGSDFNRHPIGSAEFEFVSYDQDDEVVLRRSETYFGEKPAIEAVRFKIIPEAVVRALEVRKGSVDIDLNVLTPDMVEVLKHDPSLKVEEAPGTSYQYIAFNVADPVFKDVRVRQAIAYGINTDDIIKYLWRNQARPATGPLPPFHWAYEPNVRTYPYDPGRARELLKEAGQEHLTFTYRTSTDETGRLMASILQQQLKDIGVTMEIRSNEFATFFADVVSGNFQMYSLRWIGGNNDPDFFDSVFNSKRTPPNGFNRGHYSNARVDGLVNYARTELDGQKRIDAYREVQRIIAEEVPYISIFYMDDVCVYNTRIEGLKLHPAAAFEFLTGIRVRPS